MLYLCPCNLRTQSTVLHLCFNNFQPLLQIKYLFFTHFLVQLVTCIFQCFCQLCDLSVLRYSSILAFWLLFSTIVLVLMHNCHQFYRVDRLSSSRKLPNPGGVHNCPAGDIALHCMVSNITRQETLRTDCTGQLKYLKLHVQTRREQVT